MSFNVYDAVSKQIEKLDKDNLSKEQVFGKKYKEDIENQKLNAASEVVYNLFENNGYFSNEDSQLSNIKPSRKIHIDEVITSPQFNKIFPRVVNKIIMETVEPNLSLTPLMEKINFEGISARIPAVSSYGGNLDVPEGDKPQSFNVALGGFKTVALGKSGIMVELTDETIKYSDYSLIQYIIRQAGTALKRWKENKVANMLKDLPADQIVSGGSGLEDDGTTVNNSLTFDDILNAAMKIIAKGGMPDTIIMHPLAYPIFLKNPTLRTMFLATNGSKGDMYPTGTINTTRTTESSLEWVEQRKMSGVSGINFPNLGFPMKVIFSEFMDYTAATDTEPATSTILVADSSQLGFLVTEYEPRVTDFQDPLRDIQQFKLMEKYAVAPKSDKAYIESISNIALVKGYDPEFLIV